jgi:hypothetical protein
MADQRAIDRRMHGEIARFRGVFDTEAGEDSRSVHLRAP